MEITLYERANNVGTRTAYNSIGSVQTDASPKQGDTIKLGGVFYEITAIVITRVTNAIVRRSNNYFDGIE